MNVVFYVYNLNSGGLENYLLRFLQAKHGEFNQVFIWCKSRNEGEQLEGDFLALGNITIIKHPLSVFQITKYFKLIDFYRNTKIDTICDFTGNFSGWVLLFSRFCGVKNRFVFYRLSSDHFKKNIFKSGYNSFIKFLTKVFSTKILANSKTGLNYFYGDKWRENNKYSVIYNDININRLLQETSNIRKELFLSRDSFLIGHIGRYNSAKNHDTIIRVAEKMIESNSNVYFVMCGNGVKGNLENNEIYKKINKNVFLFENRNDVPAVLNSLDCFYFPSLTEGQPNALIEAMAKGLPFVASDIESIKETVFEKYHSQLVRPKDVDGAVLKLTSILINKKDTTEKFEDLQKLTIQKFGKGNNFEEFLKVLKK